MVPRPGNSSSEPAFNVVLVEPEIPPNTGTIGRLCLAAGARLHLVGPLGFSLEEKALRRAGLDYWNEVDCIHWDSLGDFLSAAPAERTFLLTTKSTEIYWDATFQRGDWFVFGSETRGLPERLLSSGEWKTLTIPMKDRTTRSLNLATAVGIVLFEGLRQVSP